MFCTDIHGAQMMNPNAFGDPRTFLLVPPAGQIVFSKISQHLPDGLVLNFFTDIGSSQMMYRTDFSDPLTFPIAP